MPGPGLFLRVGLTGLFEELLDFPGQAGVGFVVDGFQGFVAVEKFNCCHGAAS